MRRYTATYLLEDGTHGVLDVLAPTEWDAHDAVIAALEGGPTPRMLRIRAA